MQEKSFFLKYSWILIKLNLLGVVSLLLRYAQIPQSQCTAGTIFKSDFSPSEFSHSKKNEKLICINFCEATRNLTRLDWTLAFMESLKHSPCDCKRNERRAEILSKSLRIISAVQPLAFANKYVTRAHIRRQPNRNELFLMADRAGICHILCQCEVVCESRSNFPPLATQKSIYSITITTWSVFYSEKKRKSQNSHLQKITFSETDKYEKFPAQWMKRFSVHGK